MVAVGQGGPDNGVQTESRSFRGKRWTGQPGITRGFGDKRGPGSSTEGIAGRAPPVGAEVFSGVYRAGDCVPEGSEKSRL